jgi:hypothetical protein
VILHVADKTCEKPLGKGWEAHPTAFSMQHYGLLSSVMNLVFKPAEHHRLVHLLTGINPFNNQMAKGI